MTGLSCLPKEVIIHNILPFLSQMDLVEMSLVNTRLAILTHSYVSSEEKFTELDMEKVGAELEKELPTAGRKKKAVFRFFTGAVEGKLR